MGNIFDSKNNSKKNTSFQKVSPIVIVKPVIFSNDFNNPYHTYNSRNNRQASRIPSGFNKNQYNENSLKSKLLRPSSPPPPVPEQKNIILASTQNDTIINEISSISSPPPAPPLPPNLLKTSSELKIEKTDKEKTITRM
jgi:hypothetical protein